MDLELKKVRMTSEEDRISSLPDELIHQILKFVDTKLAVQTSVLSKRWKLIWTTLPFLNFEWDQQCSSKNTTSLTRHVLNHRNHQSQISSLELSYLAPGLTDKFVKYAISHQVQDLTVHFRRNHKPYKLSNFNSSSIQKLELRIKLEKLVSKSDCWDLPSLTTLHLRHFYNGSVYHGLPFRYLTCLPALRTLCLTSWDFWGKSLHLSLSLPDLTTLHLSMCNFNENFWNLPTLKTLTLSDVAFLGNMTDVLAALVSLQNLTIHNEYMQDCFINCPQLINLEIKTRIGKIVVLAPKLSNFTSVGIFPITFEASSLDNVYLRLRGWIRRKDFSLEKLKKKYQRFTSMLPGLGSAKILNLELETIQALSSISDFLVSSPSPFYNLKYVKLPHGLEEASISNILRSYLLGASPTAIIVTTSLQMASASWDDKAHRLFVSLCLSEVQAENRPNTSLSKLGWNNVQAGLKKHMNVDYTVKQLRNHWDAMKNDWQLFKKLKSGYTGLGWNEVTKSIDADDQWWNERIAENNEFKKFRGEDLSAFWFSYDELFSDIVATGDRARTPSQHSAVGLEFVDEFEDLIYQDDEKEGSDDSDEAPQLCPSCSMKSLKSSGSKRKKSAAEIVREGIDNLVAAMSCRITATTAATDDGRLDEALTLLDAMCDGTMHDLHPDSDLYFFAQQYILNKGNRTLFLKARTNEHRYGQLQYNHNAYKTRLASGGM